MYPFAGWAVLLTGCMYVVVRQLGNLTCMHACMHARMYGCVCHVMIG